MSNSKEKDLCEKLLVEYIGPNAKAKIFSYDQQRQMFKAICSNNAIRSLVHHWGVLEADDHQSAKAEELLKRALEIPNDAESFRGESDQNILTSLGTLYVHEGIDLLKGGNTPDAEVKFEQAEESFQNAKYGAFPNAFAYHGHAYMWYLRGKQTADFFEKANFFGKGLEILAISKDNLSEDSIEQILELETTIWSEIGDEAKISQILETLRDKYNSARGYFLNANLVMRNAIGIKEKSEKAKELQLALRKVEKGLKYFPNSECCLLLKCKLTKELEPFNYEALYKSLAKLKPLVTIPNAWLLYELGRTSFILGYYEWSKDHFKELETGVGIGHKMRSVARNPIIDNTGKEEEFDGTVSKINSPIEGYIRCDTLRNLKYNITFRPIACNFTPNVNNQVKFRILFSYRGPRAEYVRKI